MSETLYAALESRYECPVEQDADGLWVADVWLVSKREKFRIASFINEDMQAARDEAYKFMIDRPR